MYADTTTAGESAMYRTEEVVFSVVLVVLDTVVSLVGWYLSKPSCLSVGNVEGRNSDF